MKPQKKVLISATIGLAALLLAYVPIPGVKKTIVVVTGTELAEPLQEIGKNFQTKYPDVELILKFQGSQDLINNYVDKKNDFKPTVLIPASKELLEELKERWNAENKTEAFVGEPTPIAKTLLVAIAWPERAKVLFPNGNFSWTKIEQAMMAGNWQTLGGQKAWGSFDFITTDPTRSNSGQVTLSLWAATKSNDLNDPAIASLFSTIKQSVYQPPRSTDILLQEFIARGPNDADVATVYESIALSRWQQAQMSRAKPYQIFYPNPTVETVATAAVVKRDINDGEARAGQDFVKFVTEREQQEIFARYGFRPTTNNIDLKTVANSSWNQNIPGVEIQPQINTIPAPKANEVSEILRLWQRVK